MRRSPVAVVLCGLLSGCLVGPDYVQPQVDTPATFLYEPREAADTANTEWWKQFGDPVLDELILRRSPTTATSRSPRPTSSRRPAC